MDDDLKKIEKPCDLLIYAHGKALRVDIDAVEWCFDRLSWMSDLSDHKRTEIGCILATLCEVADGRLARK